MQLVELASSTGHSNVTVTIIIIATIQLDVCGGTPVATIDGRPINLYGCYNENGHYDFY